MISSEIDGSGVQGRVGWICTFGCNEHLLVVDVMGLHEIIWEVSIDRAEVLELNHECYRLEGQGGINKKD